VQYRHFHRLNPPRQRQSHQPPDKTKQTLLGAMGNGSKGPFKSIDAEV
jgi:hypothetical protein